MVAERALAVAVALAAVAAIDWVAVIAITASLTMLTLSVISTGLLTHPHTRPCHITRAVTITLTRGTRGEVPLLLSSDLTRVRG